MWWSRTRGRSAGRHGTTLALILALSGCGYHLQGAGGSALPPHIKRIHIPIFRNNTMEQGIEVRISDAVRNIIINDGRVQLATGISDADAILRGEVLDFRLRPISFSRGDRAQEFRLRVSLRVSMRDLENDRLLFRQTILADREYQVSANLSTNEQAEAEAIQKASEDLARELQGVLIEGF